MNDEEIKKRLGWALDERPLPDVLWEALEEEFPSELDLVRGLRNPEDEVEWSDLVYDARQTWRIIRRALQRSQGDDRFRGVRPGVPNRRRQERHVDLSEYGPSSGYGEQWTDLTPKGVGEEREQAEALGEYMALCALLNPGMRDFRDKVLGGDTLSPEKAHEFVSSLANRWYGQSDIESWGISPTDHQALPVPVYYPEFDTGGECVDLEPLGKRLFLPDDEMDQRFAGYLYFPSQNGDFFEEPRRIAVGRGSVLDRLMQLGEELIAAVCSAWNQAQASWFVLTGEATPAAVLVARSGWRADHGFDHYGWYGSRAITLTAEPWVSAEEVMRAYRAMQKGALGRQRNRESPEANRALFKFVIERLRKSLPPGELSEDDWLSFAYVVRLVAEDTKPQDGLNITGSARPSWGKLRQQWNQWCKDEAFRYDEDSNFRRAFLKTARRIVPRIEEPYSVVTPPNYPSIRASRLRQRRRRRW